MSEILEFTMYKMRKNNDYENDHPNTLTTSSKSLNSKDSSQSTSATAMSTSLASNIASPSSQSNLPSSVQVAIRVRPVLPAENGSHKCITIQSNNNASSSSSSLSTPNIGNMVEIGAGGSSMGDGNSKRFVFDACFSPQASQKQVFEYSVQPLVDACLDGYNATVLAVSYQFILS